MLIRASQYDDYVLLRPGGGFTVFRNRYYFPDGEPKWAPMPEVEADRIGRNPEEIDLKDVNG